MADGTELIPLSDIRRLNVQPGDTIAVIAPDWATGPYQANELAEYVVPFFAERGAHAIVLPPGADIALIRPGADS